MDLLKHLYWVLWYYPGAALTTRGRCIPVIWRDSTCQVPKSEFAITMELGVGTTQYAKFMVSFCILFCLLFCRFFFNPKSFRHVIRLSYGWNKSAIPYWNCPLLLSKYSIEPYKQWRTLKINKQRKHVIIHHSENHAYFWTGIHPSIDCMVNLRLIVGDWTCDFVGGNK